VAKEIFDQYMPQPNQIDQVKKASVTAADLVKVPEGPITEKGLRQNINVGMLYIEAWFGGSGAVPLYNLMEDAATAEISRTQVWQWIHHDAKLDDGRPITAELYTKIRDEELKRIGDRPHLRRAAALFDRLTLADELADFLTIPAYDELLQLEKDQNA
jgi:malate synthase